MPGNASTQRRSASRAPLQDGGKNMGQHGLIKQTRIEPQNDMRMGCGLRQSLVLMAQCFQDAVPVQTACGECLQKQGTRTERIVTWPTRLPGAIIENVMPHEHFSGKTRLGQTLAGNIAAGDMKYLFHSPPVFQKKSLDLILHGIRFLCKSSPTGDPAPPWSGR